MNGNPTGYTKSSVGYHSLSSFQLNSGFIEGINTLEFRVNNESGPTGLCVSGLELVVVPEPGSGVLLVAGLAALWRVNNNGRRD